MAKNKKKRRRSYKVQVDVNQVPHINIKGKFLEDLDMGRGTHLEMIETDNMLILRKQTAAEISLKEVLRLRTTYKRLFNLCERYLETCIAKQTLRRPESVEFIDQLKKCGEVMIVLNVMALNRKRKASIIIDQYKAQLALCEHAFIEEDKHRIFSVVVDEYKKLMTLLKDGGKQLGIFKKRNVFGFKNARQTLLDKYTYYSQPLNQHYNYQASPIMGMVAENRESSYSVADEIANNPEKYSQA